MRVDEVINGIPHPIALLDAELRVYAMNCELEAVTGLTAKSAKGISVEHVVRSNFGLDSIRSALQESRALCLEGDIINVNRQKIPFRFTFSPLENKNGSPDKLLVFMEDISFICELNKKAKGGEMSRPLIGHSSAIQEITELIHVWANTDATLLITGETGTGKDLLAEAVHLASKRGKAPFIKVNCGAIPEALLESELFGSLKGAYTGAHADKPGMFRLAEGGTIYLTEIGDLPLQLQVKLLTVLDDREFYPLGSSKKVQIDVRIITGTHRNLKQLVEEGEFRRDLFYRLNVLRAHLPPLHKRDGDIPILLDHFLNKTCQSVKKDIRGFTKAARDLLAEYMYPGNVRELRNIVEYAVNICQGNRIDVDHLPLAALSSAAPSSEDPPGHHKNTDEPVSVPNNGDLPAETPSSWSEIEKKKILGALMNNNGNRTKAAQELGWGRSTLWRKIKQYKLG